MKKCPVCNSTKFRKGELGSRCGRCGFIHKPLNTSTFRRGVDKSLDIPSIDYHNNVFKCRITKNNFKVHLPIVKPMKNWNQEWEYRDKVKILRTPKNVLFFINKRFLGKNIDTLDVELKELLNIEIKTFEEKYKIKLDKPKPVKKEIKLLEGFSSPVQFMGKKVKCVYPDGKIEFIDYDAIDSFKNFMDNMAIETKADDLIKKMDGGFNTLSYLMTEQTKILKIISKTRPSLFQRLKRWFK